MKQSELVEFLEEEARVMYNKQNWEHVVSFSMAISLRKIAETLNNKKVQE